LREEAAAEHVRDPIDVVGAKLAERTDGVSSKLDKSIADTAIHFGKRIDDTAAHLGQRIDDLSAKVDGVKDMIASVKVWALFLYITLAAGVLTTIARGFQWL
jgi:hypothetical protein